MAFKRVGIWSNEGSKRFCTRVQNLGNFFLLVRDFRSRHKQSLAILIIASVSEAIRFESVGLPRFARNDNEGLNKNPPPRSLRRTFR